ncbi:MAG: CHAT domain-containing tetratricopeptide repeat protein [Blastocatellia bacterium]|nr:CHAT domain-containing tetratricopeptide repeat protein [Blastocatellia bacterium]
MAFLIALMLIPAVMVLEEFGAAARSVSETPVSATPIVYGQPIEREIAGDQLHEFTLQLTPNQFARIEVLQLGIDAVVEVFKPSDKGPEMIDTYSGPMGKETIILAAQQGGEYKIRISVQQKTPLPGRFRIEMIAFHEVRAEDARLIAGQEAYVLGLKMIFGDANARLRAVDLMKSALGNWLAANEPELALQVIPLLGLGQLNLGYLADAEATCRMGVERARALRNPIWEASSIKGIADVKYQAGQLREAIEYYQEYLRIGRPLGDRKSEASVLSKIAKIHEYLGDTQLALKTYQEALPVARDYRYARVEAATLSKMGDVYFGIGEYQEALRHFNLSLPISRREKDRTAEAQTLNALGKVYDAIDEDREAMDYYQRAFDQAQTVRNNGLIAQALTSIGKLEIKLGQYGPAEGHLQQALKLCHARNLRLEEAPILLSLGEMHAARGEEGPAFDQFEEALKVSQKVSDRQREMASLNQLGAIYRKRGQRQLAVDFFTRALALSREIGDRLNEAQTLYQFAALYNEAGNLIEARQKIEEAIKIIEQLRTNFSSREMRASYFGTVQNFYKLRIDALMQMSREQGDAHMMEAFTASEMARARGMLDVISDAKVGGGAGIPPEVLKRRNLLQNELLTKTRRLIDLQSSKTDTRTTSMLSLEITAIENELHALEASIYDSNPAYKAMEQPQPLKLDEIQTQILGENTLLLEYSLGERQSYLWVVSRNALRAYPLGPKNEIEEDAQKLHGLLSMRPSPDREQRQATLDEYFRLATGLSRKLFGPIAHELRNQRLMIVSEGALQYLSFGALAAPQRAAAKASSGAPEFTPLMAHHQVVGLPSATTLAYMRRQLAGRARAPYEMAVFADPVFGKYDPRVNNPLARASTLPRSNATLERSAFLSDETSKNRGAGSAPEAETVSKSPVPERRTHVISRLIYSRDEADGILKLAPKNRTMRALDFRANRDLVMSGELKNYRILHFATHGYLYDQRPDFTGLIFSTINESGQSIEGFLPVDKISNLHLGADLVVLSSCQSAIGKQFRGEGIQGLTRGFMHAGAPRVVATLWKVNDAATANLMKHFYQNMLGERKLPAAAALRQAQLAMWQDPRWNSPYYWAAFVLQGDIE